MFAAEWAYFQMVLHVARGRIEAVRNDRGASTLELAIISALLVAAAAGIATLIAVKVREKGAEISGY